MKSLLTVAIIVVNVTGCAYLNTLTPDYRYNAQTLLYQQGQAQIEYNSLHAPYAADAANIKRNIIGYPRHEPSNTDGVHYWPNPYGNFPGEMNFTQDYDYCVNKTYDYIDTLVATHEVELLFQSMYIECMQKERGYKREFLNG